MWQILQQISPYAIAFAIPLLITAIGGLYSERSGVVNIGLEGLMVIGSFAAAITISVLQPIMHSQALWIGLLAAVLAGALFSLLHAFASISLQANQVISGTAINMIAGAITVFIARNVTGSGNIQINPFTRFDIPVLNEVPVVGKLLFSNTYATTWLTLFILTVAYFVLYRTVFGLRLRACGEHPQAVASAGVNVQFIRYAAVIISGACAGLGGAIILTTYSGEFNGTVFGLGFLALAALIFGQWKPLGILGATAFFGYASTIATSAQAIPALAQIPGVALKTFPYIVTLLVLVLFSKTSQPPRASGQPFDHGKR
ncbi:ABC transporter permease [Sporomusa malonica]|uniref:Nucleoside ABC transporter membrane protein n=1 Tax=Sporomusa malonica TaxID=112901 RepID=A0A1W2BPQ2_9FIRM|nr:ABC transporter permease [Sporomusa malonica]SMC74959.1 nucleoside ABC transporter membrane protein [Sporomusa malonica]